jgi:hypothetical protein
VKKITYAARAPSQETTKTIGNHDEMCVCGRLETAEGWRWGSRGGDEEEPRSHDGEAQIYDIFYSPEMGREGGGRLASDGSEGGGGGAEES